MTQIIEMKHISKVFETEELQTHALRQVSLSIAQGEFVSVSGPSGCGKSTLLSIMGLLDEASSGQYLIQGTEVGTLTADQRAELRNRHIGFIFQSFNLIDELSVFNNVALPLRYSTTRLSRDEVQARVQSCLDKVGLSHRAAHKPDQLSGGQQQRVAIARALVANPSILLVDEPTGNLDSKSGDAVMQLIAQLHQQGTTICMVTHDPRYADMAPRQIRLLDGEIVGSSHTRDTTRSAIA
ncbi:ABC transporter ATP-binding protein [Pseudoalteromonas rubra]|uniref:ABC transporter ATP-binding protein n=1 Tax=Pseudoalteromonas rubra TaxID=43658 RepID=UPI00197EF805|nr:ABC transporter ATP-binding protein [Pseudoalteromonas rubra]